MALNWDAAKVKGVSEDGGTKDLTGEEKVVLEALIWMTLAVGIQEITAKNVDQFAHRAIAWQMVTGQVLNEYKPDGKYHPAFLNRAHVERFIGLKTNASPKTVTQFRNTLLECIQHKTGEW